MAESVDSHGEAGEQNMEKCRRTDERDGARSGQEMRRSNMCSWRVYLRRVCSRFYSLIYLVTGLRPHAHHGARCAMQTGERAHQGARSAPPPSAPHLPTCMPACLHASLSSQQNAASLPACAVATVSLPHARYYSECAAFGVFVTGKFPKHIDSAISGPCIDVSFAPL